MISNTWCDICRIHFFWALIFCRAIFHDPVMYPEPDVFKPERFIDPNGTVREDPVLTSLFGHGKRICPGRHLADATMFISVASLLSVFSIEKGNGTGGGQYMYPSTGDGLKCGHHVSLVIQRLGELTGSDCCLALRALSPVPSSQGIEEQKSLSLPMPRNNELNRLSICHAAYNAHQLCMKRLHDYLVWCMLWSRK